MSEKAPRVVVVGGVNIDFRARTNAAHIPATSNPGRLNAAPGGVGRNIAENLARLGTQVTLLGAVGNDPFADFVTTVTADVGVDVSHLSRWTGPTGSYLAVLDDAGDLVTGVADMEATDAITSGDLDLSVLDEAELLVVDGNLAALALAHLLDEAANRGLPVVIDPVSVAKAARIAPTLTPERPVATVTPNLDELGALAQAHHVGESAAVEVLHERGVESVWVRQGAIGSRLYRPGVPTLWVPSIRTAVADVTGAGDAMTAGFVHALVHDRSVEDAVRFATAMAALTVAVPDTVRTDLTETLVDQLLTKEFA